ncbi:MAG: hypothetical protein PHI97_05120 [Desulfobulbus sp.]|nr:hypothetical protein [Desulfobulbus sp.]
MKHFESVPAANPVKKGSHRRTGKRSGLGLLLTIGSVILAAGFTLTTFFHQPAGDHLADAEKTRISTEFSKVGAIHLETVPIGKIQTAIESMGLDNAQQAALQQVVTNANRSQAVQQSKEVRLMYLDLWDFATQDGDSVLVSSGGYQATVPLLKAPTKITIPVQTGQIIQVRGVQDGGGGITLGIKNGPNHVALPVLAPGQTLELPVSF